MLVFLLGVAVGFIGGAALTYAWRHRPHPDQLTGLDTRRAADQAIARLNPGDVVVMIDVDDLKSVNDNAGHAAGDDALRSLAAHIKAGVRTNDTVTRWGGDEFLLVLKNAEAGATGILDRLVTSSPVRFSAGLAVHGPEGDTLARADEALRVAKRAGGSLVVEA